MAEGTPFLVAGRLTRAYGATASLDHVDLAAAEGSVLAGDAGRLARTYSGGMRRRLDLAAALIGRPPVLFRDHLELTVPHLRQRQAARPRHYSRCAGFAIPMCPRRCGSRSEPA